MSLEDQHVLLTLCLLELAESRAEESSLEENEIWNTLHQECSCTEELTFACVKQKSILPSHCSSFGSFIGLCRDEDAFEERPRHEAEVLSDAAVISYPESMILKLLQVSTATANTIFGDTSALNSVGDLENMSQQSSSSVTGCMKYALILFSNQDMPLKSLRKKKRHSGIYLGSFSKSKLCKGELVFVPHVGVQLHECFEIFRHLPRPFLYVIERVGEETILCIKTPNYDCQVQKKSQKEGDQPGGRLENTNLRYDFEDISVIQVPATFLTHCLELIAEQSSLPQECIHSGETFARTFGALPGSNLPKGRAHSASAICDVATCGALAPGCFTTNSDVSCLHHASQFVGPSKNLRPFLKEKCRGQFQNLQFAAPGDAFNSVDLKQVTSEVIVASSGGQFAPEILEGLPSYETDDGQCPSQFPVVFIAEGSPTLSGNLESKQNETTKHALASHHSDRVQWTTKEVKSDDKCALELVLDSDWSEDRPLSSGTTKQDIAQGILLELRNLSHSLLDVFDIIQRTPPLSKKALSLPREVLSEHRVLHASTSSLESCPLAQSECFRNSEGSPGNTKRKQKKKKKCSV